MSNLVIFSASNSSGKVLSNLNSTIYGEVSIEDCRSRGLLTDDEYNTLVSLYPSGYFKCWGVKANSKYKPWEKYAVGDYAIGCADHEIKIFCKIAFTTVNAALGNYIWEQTPEAEVWKYIFFLKDVEFPNMAVDRPYSLIGYKPNYNVRPTICKEHQNCDIAIDYIKGNKTWAECAPYAVL